MQGCYFIRKVPFIIMLIRLKLLNSRQCFLKWHGCLDLQTSLNKDRSFSYTDGHFNYRVQTFTGMGTSLFISVSESFTYFLTWIARSASLNTTLASSRCSIKCFMASVVIQLFYSLLPSSLPNHHLPTPKQHLVSYSLASNCLSKFQSIIFLPLCKKQFQLVLIYLYVSDF